MLSKITYTTTPSISETIVALRKSFEQVRIEDWDKAINILVFCRIHLAI